MSRPARPVTRAAQPELTTLEGRRLLTALPVARSLSPSTLVSRANLRITTFAAPHLIQTAATGTAAALGASSPVLVNSASAVAGSPLTLSRVKAETLGSEVDLRTAPRTIIPPVAVPTFAASRVATTSASGRFITQPSTLTHPTVSILNVAGGGPEKSFTAREV